MKYEIKTEHLGDGLTKSILSIQDGHKLRCIAFDYKNDAEVVRDIMIEFEAQIAFLDRSITKNMKETRKMFGTVTHKDSKEVEARLVQTYGDADPKYLVKGYGYEEEISARSAYDAIQLFKNAYEPKD